MTGYTECWARDGLQAESFVPTEAKLAVLEALAGSGVTRVEVTSLAHPRVWPQFADAEAVLARYHREPGVAYSAYVPNLRGLHRLLGVARPGLAVDSVLLAVAASSSYNEKNVGRSFAEAMADVVATAREAVAAGLGVVGCVGTAWACPIDGPVPVDRVLAIAADLVAAGATELVLGDTTGEADPASAQRLVAAVKERFDVPVAGHFHDARGTALANALAAVAAGADAVEGSLGGVGGHPPDEDQPAASPNLCSEDFLVAATAMGLRLDVRLDAVLRAGELAEVAQRRQLLSGVQRHGLPEVLRT